MSNIEDIDPYHGLASLDPTEWLNIPRPIVESLRVFKELAIEHTNKIQDIADTIKGDERNNNEEFKKIGKDFQVLKSAIAKSQEETMGKIEDININILAEISKFKTNLLVDLDYKQKNNDSKIAYLEEQIFHIRKYINAAPTIHDIENKITDACGELRIKLKGEIKETLISPEVRGINYDIRELSTNLKNLICETEDRVVERQGKIFDSIDHVTSDMEKIQRKITMMGGKQIETNDNVAVSLKKIEDLKSYVDSVDRKQNQGLEHVNSKFNPLSKAISAIDILSEETKEKVIEFEKIIQNNKDIIIQLESAIVTMARNHDDQTKQMSEAIKKLKSKKNKKTVEEDYQDPDEQDEPSIEIPKNHQPEMHIPMFDHSGGSELAIKDFKTELSDLKTTLLKSAKDAEEKLIREVEKNMKDVNDLMRKIKQENDESFKEINEKLNWFPVNINQMPGMTASEARLFTLEARLRSEENSRIKSFNFLGKIIERLQYSRNIFPFTDQGKDVHTPEIHTFEILKKISENERKAAEIRENHSNFVEGSYNEENVEYSRRQHRTPKSRDFAQEVLMKDPRTNSVMGRRVLRRSLN